MNRVSPDGMGNEPYRVVVGFNNQRFSATVPLIELVATRRQLEFRARFGFGRFVGPWRVDRAEVTKLFRAPGFVSDRVAIQGSNHLDWTIYTFHPEPILLNLEDLGYPVDWFYRAGADLL
ncbi:hypothetical protein [Arthrobacter cavernae]|uniref:Uncharacterized protein n=1 Tax=Arthrobacter cavernae TaxID=2817681 RepID=A0A939HJX6_9MICC|nr:hypothetical protein [Arthrobacter cavernae]MBO1269553.1 hypothetical protein [Arthrobacter cavernae]